MKKSASSDGGSDAAQSTNSDKKIGIKGADDDGQKIDEGNDQSPPSSPDWEGDAKVFTAEDEARERAELTREERILMYADLYGAAETPPDELSMVPFERALNRIPNDQKSTFKKLSSKGVYTRKQAALFMSIENHDAEKAAERFLRYWDLKYAAEGDDCFKTTNEERTEHDLHRVYEMANAALADKDNVDKETRSWAAVFVESYWKGHIEVLEEEVNRLPPESCERLVDAFEERPDIASDERLLLQFLLCENFDPKKASRRMADYWEYRFDLWGPDDVYTEITIEYLTERYPAELEATPVVVGPGLDKHRRGIIWTLGERFCNPDLSEEGLLKVAWYMWHAALETKAIRKNGVVNIFNHLSMSSTKILKPPRLLRKYIHFVNKCMPIKIGVRHGYVPSSSVWEKLMSKVKYLVGKRARLTYVEHKVAQGIRDVEDISVKLEQEYGLQKSCLPGELGGPVGFEQYCMEWIAERRKKCL